MLKDQFPNLYIVACTANAFDEAYEKCRESGFDDIITKPMRRKDLECYMVKN